MYLSRMVLNPAEMQVKHDLANPYELHRTIMGAFPNPLPKEERVLFRVECEDNSAMSIVLVQSIHQPDWHAVQRKKELYFSRQPQVCCMDELRIKQGDWLRFRLRADPSKRVYYAKKEKSQRISLFSEEDRKQWLLNKAKKGGFSIYLESLLITPAPYRTIFIAKEEKTHKATINMVDYNGVLKVDNWDTLLTSLRQGIGPAKGLGCGLLSLARF